MSTGYGHAFDSLRMLLAATTVTADISGGQLHIRETPMHGLTARMLISSWTASETATATASGTATVTVTVFVAAALRLRIMTANGSGSTFHTIAASPPINNSVMDGAPGGTLEVLVRFGTDWDYIKYVIDTYGSVNAVVEVGLVDQGVKFPDWNDGLDCTYWTDGTDAQA
jgi:hypothetical protein